MTCKKFLDLMYLRDDELDPKERAEVDRHREVCASCASEYARVRSSLAILSDLKKQDPLLTDPLLVTNAVIGRIEQEAMGERTRMPESVIDRWAEWLSAPRVRMALGTMLLLITASFAAEYTSAFMSMKQFEDAIGAKTSLYEQQTAAAGLDQPRLITAATDLAKLIAGKQSSAELSENWVVMNKQSFERFILLYDELKDHVSELPPEFRAEHPELMKLLEMRQRSAQVEMLVKEREALIRELNALLPKGGKQP